LLFFVSSFLSLSQLIYQLIPDHFDCSSLSAIGAAVVVVDVTELVIISFVYILFFVEHMLYLLLLFFSFVICFFLFSTIYCSRDGVWICSEDLKLEQTGWMDKGMVAGLDKNGLVLWVILWVDLISLSFFLPFFFPLSSSCLHTFRSYELR